jgi:hypothetical protein
MAWWGMWVFVAILFYVLSVGPVVRLCNAAGIPRVLEAAKAVYAPLGFAYARFPGAAPFIDWYLHIWGIENRE